MKIRLYDTGYVPSRKFRYLVQRQKFYIYWQTLYETDSLQSAIEAYNNTKSPQILQSKDI